MLNPKGSAPPQPVQKPVQKPVPQGPGAAVGAAPHTPAPSIPVAPLPQDPPHKELLKLGINSSIDQVNNTIAQAAKAHRNLFGTDPTPGLLFDVVRGVGNGMVKDVNHLFDVPLGPRQVAAMSAASSHEVPPEPKPNVPLHVQQQLDSIPAKTIEHLHTLGIDPAKLLTMNPEARDVYVSNAMRDTVQKKRDAVMKQTQAENLSSEFIVFGRAIGQISHSIKDIPYGIERLAVATGKDVHDLATWPVALIDTPFGISHAKPRVPTHLFDIGKGLVEGVGEDIAHPRQRVGYLAMDVFALLTLGVGGGARVATGIGRVGELGDEASIASRAATFARTAAKRPHHEPIELGFGAYQANVPAFDNAVMYRVQKFVIASWNRKLIEAHNPEVGLSVARNTKIYNFFLSPERWTKRVMDNNMAVDISMDTFPAHELARLNTWHARAQSIRDMAVSGDLRGAYSSMKRDDRFATGKLMTLIFTEDPNPVRVWTSFHERQIEDAKKSIANIEGLDKEPREVSAMMKKQAKIIRNHTAQLDAIKRAVEMMNSPTPQMQQIIDKAYEISDAQEKIKSELLGFDPAIMARHNSEVAAIVRGEHVVHDETGAPVGIMEKGQIEDKILARKEKNAENRLNKEKRKLNTLEKNLAAPSRKSGVVSDRPALRAKVDAQREAVAAATDDLLVHRHHREILGSRTIPLDIYERSTKKSDLTTVYHGTPHDYEKYDLAHSGEYNTYGPGLYVSEHPEIASRYAMKQISAAEDPRLGERSRVNIHRIDKSKMFSLGRDDKEYLDAAKKRIEAELTPQQIHELHAMHEDWSWSDVKTGRQLHDMITVLGNILINEGKLKDFREGNEFSSDVFQRAGYQGLTPNSTEHVIFNPEDLHPAYDEPGFDPSIDALRAGRKGGYISTRTPIRADEEGPMGRAFGRISKGKYGISKPRVTTYRMTGDALQMGDFLIDTSDLLAKELTHAVKAGMEMDKWQKVWDTAISTEDFNRFYPDENNHMVPVRDVRSVPRHLKQFVNAMARQKIDRKMVEQMDEQKMDELRHWLYPTKDEILKEGDQHVRWMDERFFAETWDKQYWMKADRLMSNVMAPINEPMRFLLIFGTPAYMLNTVGSAGLLLTKQGFLAPMNLGRAFASARIYGGEVARFLDVGAGSTHAMALETEINAFTKGSQKIAQAWQRATDLYFRRAAVIGRLREAGLLKDDTMSPEDIMKELTHEDNRVTVRQAFQQARNDMLDFEKMTWPEKAILRHLVFVYAFMRAGSIYSVRWLLEHPIQADVLTHIGEDRKKEIERLVGKTPSWFLNENYFPIGGDTVLNGVQLNIPDTLNQLAYPFAGLANAPYENLLDLAGPTSSMIYESLTGTQVGGKPIAQRTGFRPVDSFIDLFSQTPPGFFLRDKKKDVALPAPSTTSGTYDPIAAAHSQESAAIKQPTFQNVNLWGGWGQVILRSALPRHPNEAGMAARYWRDLQKTDPKAWAQHQVDLVHQMLERQAKALGEPIPDDVKKAVDLVAEREVYIDEQKKAWTKKHGGTLDTVGDRQLAQWTIAFLRKNAYIDEGTARRYSSALNQAKDSRQAGLIWKGALREAGTKPWETWVQRADEVDKFTQPGFADILASLKERKLGNFEDAMKADRDTKWAYGRKFADYTDRLHQFTVQMGNASRGTERSAIRADMKDYIERNDKPVTIGGHTFPSPVRVAFARLSPEAQAGKVISAATEGWSSLDSFSKELLGHPSNEDATYGYRNLTRWIDAYKKANPGSNPPSWLKKGYVEYLEKKLPGFKTDYEFARQPLAYRLQQFNPIKKSQYVDQWNQLLKLAEDRSRSLTKAGYTKTGISDQWTQYDLPTVQRWVNGLPVGFRRELARWEKEHPRFLDGLVK